MKLLSYERRILSINQLKRLNEHQYAHKNCSLLDPYLQKWWNWLVTIVPLWIAPNLITIVGLAINLLTALILIWYSPDAKAVPPRWTCFLCALGLFIYQSLDAIDGKQARRTGSSSPLGELFDHGCDSISTVFVVVSACISIRLGFHPGWMFYQCFCAMLMFYCAHWQTYVCGVLKFGKIDVTEAHFTIILILLISAIFGSEIWSVKLFHGYFQPWYIILLTTIVSMFNYLLETFRIIRNEGVGKNGSTVAGTSVLSPIIPISLVLLPAFIIYQKSTEEIFESQPVLYVIAFGLVAAKITNKLVVAHMTKSELEYLDWSLAGPAMLFLNQYFNTFFNEYHVLWLCFIWVLLDFMRYSNQICYEICSYLHIRLFSIPYNHGRNVIDPRTVATGSSNSNQSLNNSFVQNSSVSSNGFNSRTNRTRPRKQH